MRPEAHALGWAGGHRTFEFRRVWGGGRGSPKGASAVQSRCSSPPVSLWGTEWEQSTSQQNIIGDMSWARFTEGGRKEHGSTPDIRGPVAKSGPAPWLAKPAPLEPWDKLQPPEMRPPPLSLFPPFRSEWDCSRMVQITASGGSL